MKSKKKQKNSIPSMNLPLNKKRTSQKIRADLLVVNQGFAETPHRAQALIMAGEILWKDQKIKSAGQALPSHAALRHRPRRGHGYVGRGGLKMERALRLFKLSPQGWRCLDLGMSTGGFTDCLLQSGAAFVYGVDVGVGLAHQRLVLDQRVQIWEGTHVKDLTAEQIDEKCDLCVADLSFTSLNHLIEPALPFLKPNAHLLLLVKPQFELESQQVNTWGNQGVISAEYAQQAGDLACKRVASTLQTLGCHIHGWKACEVKGTKGNQEFFLYAQML